MLVGGDAYIAPFGAVIDEGGRVDVGIDPYEM